MGGMRKQPVHKAFCYLVALCASFTWADCDQFLVSICNFEDRPGCTADGSSQSGQDGGQGTSLDANPPALPQNGPERSFEWRASIPIDGNTKFVGMLPGEAVTWKKNNPTNFLSWRLDLNNQTSGQRTIGISCVKCADLSKLPDVDFLSDQIYVTGGFFYQLKYHRDYILNFFDTNQKTTIDNITVTNSATPRPFAHPVLNYLIASIQNSPKYNAGVAVIQNQAVPTTVTMDTTALTTFLVGDLDSIDQKQNGDELLQFFGIAPKSLYHLVPGASPESDSNLLGALSNSIFLATGSNGNPIVAAFIENLNNDKFPDLLYAKGNSIYATSYLGRNFGALVPVFQNWSAPIPITETNGETIKSLIAMDLTNDSFPELIVETDKAVHFYVNKAK